MTSKYVGEPWGLFAVRPDAERSLILDKPRPIEIIESRQSFGLGGPSGVSQGGPAWRNALIIRGECDAGVIQCSRRGRSQSALSSRENH